MNTSKRISTMVIALALTFSGTLSHFIDENGSAVAAPIISDDFEGSFDGTWEIVEGRGELEIVNGRLNVTPLNQNAIVIRPFKPDGTGYDLEDISIHASFRIPNGMDTQVGFVVRNGGYSAAMDTENAAGPVRTESVSD